MYTTKSDSCSFIRGIRFSFLPSSTLRSIYAFYVLAIVTMAYGIAQLHRNFFSVAAPILQRQLGLSDSEAGILTGIGFTLPYTVAGLLLGRIADVWKRKVLIVACIIGWSVATSLHGLCSEFWHFLVCRLVIAMAQAGLSPCVYSLLADYFASDRRSTALAIYTFGIFLGYSASFLWGIALPDRNTDSQLWRQIFITIGVPGVILGVIMLFTVAEPYRGRYDVQKSAKEKEQSVIENVDHDEPDLHRFSEATAVVINDDERQHLLSSQDALVDKETGKSRGNDEPRVQMTTVSLLETIKFLSSSPSFWLINLAVGIRGIGGWTLIAWLPTFYDRVFDMGSVQQAYWLSWVFPLGGAMGLYLSGSLADELATRHPGARGWICAISSLLSIVFQTGTLMVPNATASMLLMIPTAMTTEMWNGCAGSILVEVTPPPMRTFASSVLFSSKSLLGGLGPWLIAYLNMLFEHLLVNYGLFHGGDTRYTIMYSMVVLLNVTCLASAATFALLAFTTKRDMHIKEEYCERQAAR